MAAATKQEGSTGAVVATGARGIRRMLFVPLTASNGPWLGPIRAAQFNSLSAL